MRSNDTWRRKRNACRSSFDITKTKKGPGQPSPLLTMNQQYPTDVEESKDGGFKSEWSRLPIRGPKTESRTELVHWVHLNPTEWLQQLEAKVVNSSAAVTPDSSLFQLDGGGDITESCWDGQNYQHHSPSDNKKDTLSFDVDLLLASIDDISTPRSWNNFQSLQEEELTPLVLVDQIRKLVVAIETQSNFIHFKSLLGQIHDHFSLGISHAKTMPKKEQTLDQVDKVCIETITELQSLLTQAMSHHQLSPQEEAEGEEGLNHHGTTMLDTTSSMDHPYQEDGMNHHRPSPNPTTSSTTTGAVSRAAFHSHMNNWLRANWINPYPDEAVSHQLAYETGENVHVVNTWLVNARSRRWRPAVLRAFELGRPSEYLLEDSINLFEDRPLRPIHHQEMIHVSPTTTDVGGNNKRARIN